jgi:hypothetical protein
MLENKLSWLRAAAALAASVAAVATGVALPANATTASTTSTTSAAAAATTLLPGQSLKAGQYIRSANGLYTLQMQNHGNVTLTKKGSSVVLWDSGTYRFNAVLVMAQDGTLQVIWGRTRIWSIGVNSPGAKLVLPDNGNLATYNTRGKAVWNRHMVIGTLMPGSDLRGVDAYGRDVTMYSTNRVYTLQMRTDGNLVLLQNGTTVLWSTNVTGWPNSSASIRADGRFATRNQNGEETYVIDTRRPGTVLQLRNDAHLLLIHGRTIYRTLH